MAQVGRCRPRLLGDTHAGDRLPTQAPWVRTKSGDAHSTRGSSGRQRSPYLCSTAASGACEGADERESPRHCCRWCPRQTTGRRGWQRVGPHTLCHRPDSNMREHGGVNTMRTTPSPRDGEAGHCAEQGVRLLHRFQKWFFARRVADLTQAPVTPAGPLKECTTHASVLPAASMATLTALGLGGLGGAGRAAAGGCPARHGARQCCCCTPAQEHASRRRSCQCPRPALPGRGQPGAGCRPSTKRASPSP